MKVLQWKYLRWALALGVVGVIYLASLGLAVRHADLAKYYKDRAVAKVQDLYHKVIPAKPVPPPTVADAQTIRWETKYTQLHVLQIATITLSPKGAPAIWALAEVGNNILFASRMGKFGYLDASYRVKPLDLQVPMQLEELRKSPLVKDPIFEAAMFRTTDLLSIPTGPNSYDLYAAHHRFTGECFQLVVSRTRLTTTADGNIAVASPDWEEIYVARPCIKTKDVGLRFGGHELGGRLVQLDNDTLLLSVGIFQFNGLEGLYKAGQDPETDLGKIIEISISQHTGKIYAQGFRNPQGLLVGRDGRIWETEHGPRGGDEVNLIRRGVDYGWPTVTYGMQYGGLPTPWPHNPDQGAHHGFATPQYAFVPSIGISNIIEPNVEEFPLWNEHLLASSLVGQTLYGLKLNGDDIVYAEPIRLNDRMRDMISLRDGRIAIVTDTAKLFLIRNADRHTTEPRSFTVAGLTSLPPADPLETAEMELSPLATGERWFHHACSSCHSLAGQVQAGPPLNGLAERGMGKYPGYAYTEALAGLPAGFDRNTFRTFVLQTDPRFAATTMPKIPNILPYDVAPVIDQLYDFLATKKANPAGVAPQKP